MSVHEQHLSSLVGERRHGQSRLRFSGDYLEGEFRRHYAGAHYAKVRPLLVLAAVAVICVTGVGLAENKVSGITATFGLAVMMPLLLATLVASYQSDQHYFYQPLLAASVPCVGLIVTSVTMRATCMLPYYLTPSGTGCHRWLISGCSFGKRRCYVIIRNQAWGWAMGFRPRRGAVRGHQLFGVNGMGACCEQSSHLTQSCVESRT